MGNLRGNITLGLFILMFIVAICQFLPDFIGIFGVGPNPDPYASTKPGSRLNPVPVGTTITYEPISSRDVVDTTIMYSTKFHGSVINVTLLEVIKGEQAKQIMKTTDYRKPINKWCDFLLARFKLEIIKDHSHYTYLISSLDFKATDSQGKTYYPITYAMYSPQLYGDLQEGNSIEGWIVLEYDKLETDPMIVFDHFSNNCVGLWFRTTC